MYDLRLAHDTQKQDPNDALLRQFLDRDDWRGAIRFIERICKKRSSIRMLVNLTIIQIACPDYQKVVEGFGTLRAIIDSGSPITDLEILIALDKSIPRIFYRTYPGLRDKLWKRGVEASPKDLELKDAWYESCCQNLNFNQASVLAAQGFRLSNQKHRYHWRAITCRYLDACHGNPDLRALSGGMALALGKQALKAVPDSKAKSTPKASDGKAGKNNIDPASLAVQNALDVRLLLRLYQQQNKLEEALALLDDQANTGLRSKIGGGNWQLVLEKIKLLKKMEKWAELWTFTYQLLCDAANIDSLQEGTRPYSFGKTADDMTIWKAAILSCDRRAIATLVPKLTALVYHPGLSKRHRFLATIEFSLLFESKISGVASPLASMTAIKKYLKNFIKTNVAYTDLKPLVANFNDQESDELLDELEKLQYPEPTQANEEEVKAWIYTKLNLLKFLYTFKVSRLYSTRLIVRDRAYVLDDFATRCLRFYQRSLILEQKSIVTERRAGDDAALLAACAILHLDHLNVNDVEIHAILVLEKLLQHSKHHYGAIVLLIRLYVRQGVFSKAYEHYQRLDLKNIQYYTETWVLLNRAASIFPRRGVKPNYELHEILKRHATYTKKQDVTNERMIERYQEHENYNGLCSALDFIALCSKSVSNASVLSELSRLEYRSQIGAFGENEDSPLNEILDIQPTELYGDGYPDLRSTKGFPDFEHRNTPSIEQSMSLGPVINDLWINCEQVAHHWRRVLKKEDEIKFQSEDHVKHAMALGSTSEWLNKIYVQDEERLTMTKAESLAGWAISIMAAVYHSARALINSANDLDQRTPARTDQWIHDYVNPYELYRKKCSMVMQLVFKEMKQISEDFLEDPVTWFHNSKWEVLHMHSKISEVLMIYPKCMAMMMGNVAIIRGLARGSTVDLGEYDSLQYMKLRDELKTYLNMADTIVKNYSAGAEKIIKHWDDVKNLDKLIGSARGNATTCAIRRHLPLLCSEDWTREMCLTMVQEWKNSLRSMAMEGSEYWWDTHWAAASYIL